MVWPSFAFLVMNYGFLSPHVDYVFYGNVSQCKVQGYLECH